MHTNAQTCTNCITDLLDYAITNVSFCMSIANSNVPELDMVASNHEEQNKLWLPIFKPSVPFPFAIYLLFHIFIAMLRRSVLSTARTVTVMRTSQQSRQISMAHAVKNVGDFVNKKAGMVVLKTINVGEGAAKVAKNAKETLIDGVFKGKGLGPAGGYSSGTAAWRY